MKSFLILIFSKLFMFSKNIGNSDDDLYAFKAVGIFTVFLSFNIFTILAYYKCLIIKTNAIMPNTFISLLLVFSIGFSLYLFFIKEKRYINIYNQFIKNKKLNGNRGTVITSSYLIVTILLLISLIWIPCRWCSRVYQPYSASIWTVIL